MKISCPACAAKYSIADEKVSDRLAKIRCRKCGATIVIDGKASPPSVYTAAGEATTDAHEDAGDSQAKGLELTVDFGEGDQRTMTVPEIVAAYDAGQITQDTYLWADGFADWKPLAEVEEVVAALNVGASGAAAARSPFASAATGPARTAARTAGRAPAPDLFGGIDAAGGEDDVSTSAVDQGGRDRLDLGSASAATAPAAGGTGARNESSVLFSLSALTSAASRPSSRPVAPVAAPSGAATREDSGLIDLKALTAAATKSEATAAPALAAAPLGISPLAAAPLGMAAPLGGGGLGAQAVDYGMPQAKNKTGLYIGGGLAVAAVAAVAIVFMLRPPPPPPAAPPVVAAAPTPPPAPTPAPSPELTATPPSTGTAAAEDAPKAGAKSGAVKRGGSYAPKKGGSAAPAAAPAGDAPAAAPKPKRNPCGCAAGDLQCAMRCAAG
ncbi:MAG TPA: zinc-ribbon domain-containing protein [Polyangiaceae bacterium]|nr:zinc-ribbon domain-containing protein [Polyangiaceae bacterium]